MAAAAAGGGLSSLSARLDSPGGGGRPRLQLAPRTKPLPKLEIKVLADDDSAADRGTSSNQSQNAGNGGGDEGNAPMKILARPKDQNIGDKAEKDKDGKGRVIDVAASERLIAGALGGLGGKSGKGGAKSNSTGGPRVVGETEVVSAPDGTVQYRITIGDDDGDEDDHDHDDESISASSGTGPNRGRGGRKGRGRGGGGGGRGGRGHGGRGRGRTGGGGGGRGGGGGDGGEKGKAPKNEKKQQHRAPSRFEKQSDGSVKLYKGKSKGSGKGNASKTGSKQSSLSTAAAKGGKK